MVDSEMRSNSRGLTDLHISFGMSSAEVSKTNLWHLRFERTHAQDKDNYVRTIFSRSYGVMQLMHYNIMCSRQRNAGNNSNGGLGPDNVNTWCE